MGAAGLPFERRGAPPLQRGSGSRPGRVPLPGDPCAGWLALPPLPCQRQPSTLPAYRSTGPVPLPPASPTPMGQPRLGRQSPDRSPLQALLLQQCPLPVLLAARPRWRSGAVAFQGINRSNVPFAAAAPAGPVERTGKHPVFSPFQVDGRDRIPLQAQHSRRAPDPAADNPWANLTFYQPEPAGVELADAVGPEACVGEPYEYGAGELDGLAAVLVGVDGVAELPVSTVPFTCSAYQMPPNTLRPSPFTWPGALSPTNV